MTLQKARFVRLAELELNEAIVWYEAERTTLGVTFGNHVERTVNRALEQPDTGVIVHHRRIQAVVRRYQVDDPFPYDLVGTVVSDELIVLAISHHRRRPTYWRNRITTL
jgi:hypothetical protein